MKKILAGAATVALLLSGCSSFEPSVSEDRLNEVNTKASGRDPYIPVNDVEFNNYNRAQELYDDPNSILWCTTTWSNPSAPLVTYPIAGKLTSSSVSYFPNKKAEGNSVGVWLEETRSVDGMYHGTPGPYRYGFTPGGQYVDFTNKEVDCTTALTSFQRQETQISITVDEESVAAQDAAEAALAAGDAAGAQEALSDLQGNESEVSE